MQTPGCPCLDPKVLEAIMREGVARPAFQPETLDTGALVTHCNQFVRAVFDKFPGTSNELAHPTLEGETMLAADMARMMANNPATWYRLACYHDALNFARRGHFVVLALEPGPGEHHGHVCLVNPDGSMQLSQKWGMFVPTVANVGKTNFYGLKMTLAYGDPDRPPAAFMYAGAV
jgi:hypothetical protein